MLGLPAPEHFPTLLPVSSFSDDDARLVMATTAGGIKCTQLSAFEKIRQNGLGAIKLHEVSCCMDNPDNHNSIYKTNLTTAKMS